MSVLNLSTVPRFLWDKACKCLNDGDVIGLMCTMDNENYLRFIAQNYEALIERGIYEAALFDAWTGCRTNWHRYSNSDIQCLFIFANREKMLSLGYPLPGDGPYTIYRGIAGRGSARRIRGRSWTADFEKAKWFAKRFGHLENPAVFQATVDKPCIYAYTNEREEQEFIIDPVGIKPKKVWPEKQRA